METIIIKTKDGEELKVNADKVNLKILTFEYENLLGQHVIQIDEPIGTLTIERRE